MPTPPPTADLHRHMTDEGLMYIQFAFRWMNCLLMRELPQRAVVRAWDTYLAEENGFESFHVYVSAALLCHFSGALREMDFQTMVSWGKGKGRGGCITGEGRGRGEGGAGREMHHLG